MKKLLSIILIAISFNSCAQTGAFRNLQIYDNISLRGRAIYKISNDSAFVAPDSTSVPTSWAVKYYFDNRFATLTIATGHTYVVSSQSAMLALSATVGDVAVRTDSSKSFILQTLPASTLANWVLLLFPNNVLSVFGRTGAITAQSGDYTHTQVSGVDSLFGLKQNIISNLSDTSKYLKKLDSAIYASAYQNGLKRNISDTILNSGTASISRLNKARDSVQTNVDLKQPLENQRLSTTDNVNFNHAYAKILGIQDFVNPSMYAYLYNNPNALSVSTLVFMPRLSDTLATKTDISLKQNQLNGAGFVKQSGTTTTYDNSSYEPAITAGTVLQYWRGDKTMQTLPIFIDSAFNKYDMKLTGARLQNGNTYKFEMYNAPKISMVSDTFKLQTRPQLVQVRINTLLQSDSSVRSGVLAEFGQDSTWFSSKYSDAQNGYDAITTSGADAIVGQGGAAGHNYSIERRFTYDSTLYNIGSYSTASPMYLQVIMTGFPPDSAQIHDKYLGTYTPVIPNGTTYYPFTVDGNSASTGQRFTIVYTPKRRTYSRFFAAIDSSGAAKNMVYFDGNEMKIAPVPSSGGSGTVTSVAKGFGLLADGTITTIGTVTVDTAALALKFRRLTDSLSVSLLNKNIKIDTSNLPTKVLNVVYPIVTNALGDTLSIKQSFKDSIPYLTGGVVIIGPDTLANKSYVRSLSGSGASPSGNDYDIQMKLGTSLNTPASDSLKWNAANGAFVVKGAIQGNSYGDLILLDAGGNTVIQGTRSTTTWVDNVSGQFLESGNSGDNLIITTGYKSVANRTQITSKVLQITGGTYGNTPAPLSTNKFELLNTQSKRTFAIDTFGRSVPRLATITSGSTITINSDTTEFYTITALAAAATIANPTGTPIDLQKLTIRIKDNGTARALTWGANFRGGTIALPTTTTISKTMYVNFLWNAADTKWDLQYVQNGL